MAKVRVLVYGTLKSNEGNFHVMQNAGGVSLGAATTVDADFLLVDLGIFPAAIPVKTNGTFIQGELFELDETSLHVLDSLEGYPNLYDRKEVEVCYGRSVRNEETGYWDRPVCKAWIYFMHGDKFAYRHDCIVCSGGVWYPRIHRDKMAIADLVDFDRRGPLCAFGEIVESAEGANDRERIDDYDYDDEYSYYANHSAPGAEIEVDGPDALHDAIDNAIETIADDLVDYDAEEGVDDQIDYEEITSEVHFVGIEGVAANLPIVKAAIEQALQPEESN